MLGVVSEAPPHTHTHIGIGSRNPTQLVLDKWDLLRMALGSWKQVVWNGKDKRGGGEEERLIPGWPRGHLMFGAAAVLCSVTKDKNYQ